MRAHESSSATPTRHTCRRLTNLLSHLLVRERRGGRLAEQHDPPLPPLGQLQEFVVDLVRELARGCEDDSAHPRPGVRLGACLGRAERGDDREEVRQRLAGTGRRDSSKVAML